MNPFKQQFLLDPDVTFLNHGSFGACPLPVMRVYQDWQMRLEKQPVKFLGREIFDHLREARASLGEFLGAGSEDLFFLPNATFAVNLIARGLDLNPGDELVISNHEYGACENAWRFVAQKSGAAVHKVSIPLPLPTAEEVLEQIWQAVNPNTRLIFLSQITSPTAVRLPVERICRRAHLEGISVFIDGAHAPGQLDLDLSQLEVDYYTGNCHKWLLAPKGAAFLYVRPELQTELEPLVVSWGWGENSPYEGDTAFLQAQEWWGTLDPAPYLSVPAAIKFRQDHHWEAIRADCQDRLAKLIQGIESLTGMPSIYGDNPNNFIQMAAAEIPTAWRPSELQGWLYDRYRIEIPVIYWQDRWLIRPSVQAYNDQAELDLLITALKEYVEEIK